MAIAPLTDDESVIRQCFGDCKKLYDQIANEVNYDNVVMKHLSMGMSSDFPLALEEGANMIRIGRAIFHGA